MIIEEIKNIKSERAELRKFGITLGIILGLLGLILIWRARNYYSYFIILSMTFIFISLVKPAILKPIHKSWMTLALIVGWFMTRLILIMLFYLAVTPIGILTRLLGKDFLRIKSNINHQDSYWIPKRKDKFDKNDYERQF